MGATMLCGLLVSHDLPHIVGDAVRSIVLPCDVIVMSLCCRREESLRLLLASRSAWRVPSVMRWRPWWRKVSTVGVLGPYGGHFKLCARGIQ